MIKGWASVSVGYCPFLSIILPTPTTARAFTVAKVRGRRNPTGVVANRVALEACVQACNVGRDLTREGNEIIREAAKWSPELAAAKWSPELAAACEVWKEIKFEGPAMDSL
ncbi:hypothetical protein CMV_000784 [Castanea mollissima]|uniref:Ribulose-1,5-bisphosphate carboxylase/oxygenase large subunit n=1 Tax=Castanea mollissima TaxID=60419 RepID=A0A8J4RM09_9ROSI|nr:hypothetical protein CMV_000784 [Castanea mollissima]